MRRIRMTTVDALLPGTVVEKMILARRVAVINDGGMIYGIRSECAHMRASLATGGIENGILTCRWHGWQYDLASGECLTNPGFRITRYLVEIDAGIVYLIM